jgi:hypothetical protein
MSDLDERLRTMLEERSRDVLLEPTMPREVAVRSRRRRALVGTGAGLAALAALVVGAAALRSVVPSPDVGSPSPSPSPTPAVDAWRGLWPQTTRQDAEAAQAAADAGDLAWQLDAGEVARRYALQELGFAEVHFDETFDIAEEDAPGPFVLHVVSCEQRDTVEWPPVCEGDDGVFAEVTIERLLRADRTGVWFVTAATEPAPAVEQAAPPVAGGPPETYVALTNDRDLVLVRLADGAIVRTLIEGAGEVTLGGGALTPDGSSVYVTDWSGRNPEILRVPTDGGPIESVGLGAVPTIGPDGRIAFGGCGADGCASELTVEMPDGALVRHDVSAGEERVAELAWLPDGRIAFSVGYLGDAHPNIRILDPSEPPRYLLDLPVLGPSHPDEGWRPLGYHRPTGGLAVDASCCVPAGSDELPLAEPVLSVDLRTGEHGPGIVEGAGFAVTLDRTGRWFLLVARAEDGSGGTTYLLDRDGQLRAVGEGFQDVAW